MGSVLVVHSAAAAANPALSSVPFAVSGGRLTPVAGTGGDGAQAATSSNGLATASPSWWDSGTPGAGAGGPGGADVPRPVSDSVSSSTMALNVAAAARTPGVTYPVFVDPDWTGGVLNRTFVDSAYPSTSYWNGGGASDSCQHVGYISGSYSDDGRAHVTRSYWTMNTASMVGKHIIKATFNTTETWAFSTSPAQVDLYSASGISSSTTWNSRPSNSAHVSSANVAHGFTPGGNSCPSSGGTAVGFTATSAVASAVAAGHSSVTLGLQAASESSDSGWKKFRASTSLVVQYDSAPGTAGSLSVAACAFQCASPAMVRSIRPTFTAKASDPDGGTLALDFQVFSGWATPTTAAKIADVSVNVASGTAGSWTMNANLANNGQYEFRVFATDGYLSGPISTVFKFTVDTTAPDPPTLGTPSGGVSTDSNAFAGTVGVSLESLPVAQATTADHVWGWVYAVAAGGTASTYPTNVSCNTKSGAYVVVCAGTVGAGYTITFAPVDNVTTVTVWAFDAAGNIHGNPSSLTFYAHSDPAVLAGHQWQTTPGPVDSSGNPDTAPCPLDPVSDTATTAAQPVALSGAVCWGSDVLPPGPPAVGTLSFAGSTASATTSAPVLDTTHSFTVAAWVNPADGGAGITRPILSQDGSALSGFFLQNGNGHWYFCLPDAEVAPYVGDCASTGTVTINTWMFLAAEWDATNHQLRLYVSTDGSAATPVVVSHESVPASTGPIAVGRDKIGTAYRYFNGQIYNPTAIQGLLSSLQIGALGQSTAHLTPAQLPMGDPR